jgi:acetate kinase
MLNKESGVMGISGLAPDFRVIESASYEDNERADLARKAFKYAIAGFIAKYAVAMNGIDAVVLLLFGIVEITTVDIIVLFISSIVVFSCMAKDCA